MNVLIMIFAAILVLGPLVALHEFGHFWVARKLGVKVLTYSIGFGPALFTKKGKDGVDYCISAIPLGGYVRLLDERAAEVDDAEKHLAFNNQAPWKKIAIMAAGPLMNFLIAIVLFWVLLIPASEHLKTKIGSIQTESPAAKAGLLVGDEIVSIDNKPIETWRDVNLVLVNSMGESKQIPVTYTRNAKPMQTNIQVAEFLKDQKQDVFTQIGFAPYKPKIDAVAFKLAEDGAAKRQGMLVGDKIIAINDKPVNDWYDMTNVVRKNPEVLLHFKVQRNNQTVALDIMPRGIKDNRGHEYGQIGIMPDRTKVKVPDEYKKTVNYSIFGALGQALKETWDLSVMTIKAMYKMLIGLIGLDGLSGPITIAQVAGESVNIGWEAVLSFMALISVSLGVLNLLPIPVLDGGHIVFYTYEAVMGKEMPEKVQIIGMNVGLVLMLMLMVVAISNDISRFF